MLFKLNINGKKAEIDAPSNIRLSNLLKEFNGKKSIKHNCQNGNCGLCLVLVNDKPVYSCIYPGYKAINKNITTLEGISQKSEFQNIIKGFDLAGVVLCPLCASSRTLLTYYYLNEKKELKQYMVSNIIESVSCDCNCNESLIEAIYLAANFFGGNENEK